MPGPDFSVEQKFLASHVWPVAGMDEVGRGPLAGPVVVAAVILNPDDLPEGLNDSKKLSAIRRDQLYEVVCAKALAISLGSATAQEIDVLNIRQATLLAMSRAASALLPAPAFILIDGRDVPLNLPCPGQALVKGDSLSLSIAAASIVAKVTRDRMMTRLGGIYPHYHFEDHAGYGTAAHLAALANFGPCPLHRRSFRPIVQASS